MKNAALVLIGLGLVITLMYVFVYETDTDKELDTWCDNFKQKDDSSIDEPLMQTIRETCK
jgi:hypothetical protein